MVTSMMQYIMQFKKNKKTPEIKVSQYHGPHARNIHTDRCLFSTCI